MRKRKLRLALAILLLAVIGGLTWLLVSSHETPEPVYQGKRLSEWLEGEHNTEAEQAVRQIGTNAIPTLLRMFRVHDTKFKLKLLALAQKQHLVRINFADATSRNLDAAWGFELLGSDVSNAVPALIQIYEERISKSSQITITRTLRSIGPTAIAAVPALLSTAADTNANAYVRGEAAMALGDLHADPVLAVPALIKCLKDSDPFVRKSANYALGLLGSDAKAAVPTLVDALKDADPFVRKGSELALKAIDPEAAAKAGIK